MVKEEPRDEFSFDGKEKEKEIEKEKEKQDDKMDSFCKLIISKAPKCLKVPEQFFRESMRDGVRVLCGKEEQQMGMLNSEEGEHFIKWGALISTARLAVGSLVAVRHIHTNFIRITIYTPNGNAKEFPGWTKARAAAAASYSEFSSGSDAASDPGSGGGGWSPKADSGAHLFNNRSSSSNNTAFRDQDDVRRKLHFVREGNRYITPGTSGAMSKARAFQKERLANPSLVMVLTTRAVTQRTHLPFIFKFADKCCRWGDREIVLEDNQKNKWDAFWSSGQNPGIAWGFENFVKAHKLKAGDVCVFEVIPDGFTIHTFQAASGGSGRHKEQHEGVRMHRSDDMMMNMNHFNTKRRREPEPVFGSKKSRGNNEVLISSTDSDGMQVQIIYKKDGFGLLGPHFTALVPLNQQQFNKLKGPFVSARDMLKTFLGVTGSDEFSM